MNKTLCNEHFQHSLKLLMSLSCFSPFLGNMHKKFNITRKEDAHGMQQNSKFVPKNSINCPEFEKYFRCFPYFLLLIYVVIATPYFFMYKKTEQK